MYTLKKWERDFDELVKSGWRPNNEITLKQYREMVDKIRDFIRENFDTDFPSPQEVTNELLDQ